jgi:hypothetical protein
MLRGLWMTISASERLGDHGIHSYPLVSAAGDEMVPLTEECAIV